MSVSCGDVGPKMMISIKLDGIQVDAESIEMITDMVIQLVKLTFKDNAFVEGPEERRDAGVEVMIGSVRYVGRGKLFKWGFFNESVWYGWPLEKVED